MCADIVVVGGGPVGLWTAIQAKKRNPALDVQVYERYEEYQRSHVLRLEYFSMLFCSKRKYDQAERAFYQELVGKRPSQIFQAAAGGGSSFVRTNDLENALKTYAKALGIHLTYQKIEDPEALQRQHPECRLFVAADGAHSKMRKILLGENDITDFPLQYVVEAKYQAAGVADELSVGENYKTNKLLSNMTFEYVGREKQGKTPVTLRFFVDEATYAGMPEAAFKAPIGLDDPRIPPALAQDIKTYMNVREAKAGEKYIEGSGNLTKLTLSLYRARHFAVRRENVGWFLVGDAAMGVPYFRSLNAGMIIGSQLAGILTNKLLNRTAKVGAYNLVKPLDTAWEFTGARGKDMALQSYNMFRVVNKKLPWEFMGWSKREAEDFQSDNADSKMPTPQAKKPPQPKNH